MSALSSERLSSPMTLKQSALSSLDKSIPTPSYDRNAWQCGILHMSVGGFHRSHQALYIDDLMNKQPGHWMICGVGLLPQDKVHIDTLKSQDGLYSILERNAKGDSLRICGSMKEVMHAPSDPQAVLNRMADPAIKIVSLTVTEKGYCYNQKGDLDESHPMIAHDLKQLDKPQSALGYVVGGLLLRRNQDTPPFTVMSCDNLPGNGHLTQKLVLQFATLIDKDLASWIENNVKFPNAMVDRITPVTKPEIVAIVAGDFGVEDGWPVVCEDFRQWVLEDAFGGERPALETVGVQLVKEVEPYEKTKIRLLNGSHSALSYLSYLMGYRAVDKAMADPLVSKFVRAYMDHDITPTVPRIADVDVETYKDVLIERFANPAISDQVQRLAEDGSQKIPNAILPCIEEQLKSGGSIKFACLALAGWFRYLTGVDEDLNAIEIKDPLKDELQSRIKLDPRDPAHILSLSNVFGAVLPASPKFLEELKKAMDALHTLGAKGAVEAYLQ